MLRRKKPRSKDDTVSYIHRVADPPPPLAVRAPVEELFSACGLRLEVRIKLIINLLHLKLVINYWNYIARIILVRYRKIAFV